MVHPFDSSNSDKITELRGVWQPRLFGLRSDLNIFWSPKRKRRTSPPPKAKALDSFYTFSQLRILKLLL